MAGRIVRANSGSLELQGAKELEAALLALGSEVATKIGRTANRKAAQYVASVLKQTAPYNAKDTVRSRTSKKGVVTRTNYGHLRDNIRVRLGRATKETTITYNVDTGAAFWGLFLEFGTKNMPAYPWMRSGFDAAAQHSVNILVDGIGAGITRAAKRLASS